MGLVDQGGRCEVLLSANNVSVVRQKQVILDQVSLAVNSFDFITLMGPNGAGKSTLLKCLMGFFAPDQGCVKKKSGIRIGYVPQGFSISPLMPVSVAYFLSLNQTKKDKPIEDIIQKTGIANLLKKQLSVLSGGEVQKVLLARALLKQPDVLILDEPTQGLDISSQISFYKLIESVYKTQPLAVVMVSHNLHFVMSATTQVVCLFKHICCAGKPSVVIKDPKFSALFGDEVAQVMSVYKHSHHCGDH